ncbi:sulfatase-like hydrolase/transferase [Aeoliella mucimassa]|nr:sulfatase-like hydrolase/transferase [Aeoliella mucimassa]
MIYADDMGYGDLSGFGATDLSTPNIDSLASTGVKFTNFYNSSSACSTSRASLLTGSYHPRTSVQTVFSPGSTQGLNPDEITMAEMLNGAGYQSAMVGKWHLGHTTNMMPWQQGFDRFYGIPVSHDYNNGGPNFPDGVPTYVKEPGQNYYVERVVNENNLEQVAQYTGRFSNKAAQYIRERDTSKPMFLYVAQPMPHVTLAVTDEYAGTSERGLYGDVMQELDAGVGTILQTLEDEGIRDNTIVVFAADNGPWLVYGNHSGETGDLREGKRTTFDGGVRTPAVISWPEGIDPGQVVDTPAAVMDLFPTFAAISGATVPTDRKIDGVDIRSLFMEDTGTTYDEERPLAFYDWDSRSLHAVRSGQWKLVFPHSYETVDEAGMDGDRGTYDWVNEPLALYDMVNDPGETNNLISSNPMVYAELLSMANDFRADLGDSLTSTPAGPNVRPIGTGTLLPSLTIYGDLNHDGVVDLSDWSLFRPNILKDVSDLDSAQAYLMGDFDLDGRIGIADFAAFKNQFEQHNGAGSFASLTQGVPEPRTVASVSVAIISLAVLYRFEFVQSRRNG